MVFLCRRWRRRIFWLRWPVTARRARRCSRGEWPRMSTYSIWISAGCTGVRVRARQARKPRTAWTWAHALTVCSGPDDHVFVFFSDHGAPGFVAFPNGEVRLHLSPRCLWHIRVITAQSLGRTGTGYLFSRNYWTVLLFVWWSVNAAQGDRPERRDQEDVREADVQADGDIHRGLRVGLNVQRSSPTQCHRCASAFAFVIFVLSDLYLCSYPMQALIFRTYEGLSI